MFKPHMPWRVDVPEVLHVTCCWMLESQKLALLVASSATPAPRSGLGAQLAEGFCDEPIAAVTTLGAKLDEQIVLGVAPSPMHDHDVKSAFNKPW
jgi:hypothetical protein